MSGRLLYSHPSDNLIGNATITVVAGTVLSAFPVANLPVPNPALALKFSTKRAQIQFDFGAPVAIPQPIFGHHNLNEGLDAGWLGKATPAWGSPTLDASFAIGARDTEGYRPNSFLNLTDDPAFAAFRYYLLDLDREDNDENIILGFGWLSTVVREITHNYSWGFQRTDQRDGQRRFETAGGVTWAYPSIGRRRGLTGEMQTRDAGRDAVDAWHQACGGSDQATIIIPDPIINDAWLVEWTVPYGYRGDFIDDNNLPLGWLERARGGPWP